MRNGLVHIVFLFLLLPLPLAAQDDICTTIEKKLDNWDRRLKKINTVDPELISLHYFFVEDIRKEMNKFAQNDLPNLKKCTQLDYYTTVTRYDDISFKAKHLSSQLYDKKEHVDLLFYAKATDYILIERTDSAHYFLDKALQYNPLQADALLAKSQLLLEEEQYEECVDLVHTIYSKAKLTREQEMNTSDFTLKLYDKLYYTGDSLLNHGHEAEALDLFTTLETFCKNMPTAYCNDDYYKGIMRSRKGVYESFLKIAEVAKERGNSEIESHFLEYAREYRETNEMWMDIESTDEINRNASVSATPTSISPLPTLEISTSTENSSEPSASTEIPLDSTNRINDSAANILSSQQGASDQLDCNELLLNGFQELAKGNKTTATDYFQKAKKLNGCDCITLETILKMISEE